MNYGYFLILLGYFAFLLAAGFIFSKKLKSLEDFFLAGRSLPGFLVFLSLTASWIGASSTLVSVDEAYRRGLSSFWVMGVPAILSVLIFALFLVKPIRRVSIISLPDLVEKRYGAAVRHLSALLIVWYMVLLAASQMTALGRFLETIMGTSYLTALILGTAVVLIYSIFGGFFSVVITDGLQFFLFAGGMFVLSAYLLDHFSLQAAAGLADSLGRPDYFGMFPEWETDLLMVLSFTCAWIISPIAWQRIQAAKTERHARGGLYGTAAALFIIYGVIVLSGILLLVRFPSGSREGPLLSSLISAKDSGLLGAVLFVTITAAIMSTMDTAVNTGALSLTRDIYQRLILRNRALEGIFASRAATLLVALGAVFIALRSNSILKMLGFASEVLTAGFFVPGIAMLFLKKKRPAAGLFSILLGGGYSLIGFFCGIGILTWPWPAWPESVPAGLGLSLLGFLAGAGVDQLRDSGLSK